MKIVIGSNQAGFPMKAELLSFLRGLGRSLAGSQDDRTLDQFRLEIAATLKAKPLAEALRQREPSLVVKFQSGHDTLDYSRRFGMPTTVSSARADWAGVARETRAIPSRRTVQGRRMVGRLPARSRSPRFGDPLGVEAYCPFTTWPRTSPFGFAAV